MSQPFRSESETLRRAEEELRELRAEHERLLTATPFLERFPLHVLFGGAAVLMFATAFLVWVYLGEMHKVSLARAIQEMNDAGEQRVASANKRADGMKTVLDDTQRALDDCRRPAPAIAAGDVVQTRTNAAISQALANANIVGCWQSDHGNVRITTTFRQNGTVSSVDVDPPVVTPAERACLTKTFMAIRIPASTDPTDLVVAKTYPANPSR